MSAGGPENRAVALLVAVVAGFSTSSGTMLVHPRHANRTPRFAVSLPRSTRASPCVSPTSSETLQPLARVDFAALAAVPLIASNRNPRENQRLRSFKLKRLICRKLRDRLLPCPTWPGEIRNLNKVFPLGESSSAAVRRVQCGRWTMDLRHPCRRNTGLVGESGSGDTLVAWSCG